MNISTIAAPQALTTNAPGSPAINAALSAAVGSGASSGGPIFCRVGDTVTLSLAAPTGVAIPSPLAISVNGVSYGASSMPLALTMDQAGLYLIAVSAPGWASNQINVIAV